METAPTFEMLARLEEVSKTKLLASFFRRVDLEGPVWDHLLSTPVLMTSDEFAPFADAQTLATEWVSGWLAEATEPSRLVRYMNLEDSSEFRAGIDILEAFVGALAVLRKYQKKAVNEIDAILGQHFGDAGVGTSGEAETSSVVGSAGGPSLYSGEDTPTTPHFGVATDLAAAFGQGDMPAAISMGTELDPKAAKKEQKRRLRDISRVYDHYIVSITAIVVILVFAEMKRLRDSYAFYVGEAQKLGSHFVRTALPIFERLLAFDPVFLKKNLHEVSLEGLEEREATGGDGGDGTDGSGTAAAASGAAMYPVRRAIVLKTAAIHALFAALDVVLFPPTVYAHTDGVKAIAVSNLQGDIVATGGYDGVVRIHDLSTRELMAEFYGHRSIVTGVHFTADDRLLVTASYDHTLRIWDPEAAECLQVLAGHKDSVMCSDMSGDCRLVVSGSMDRTVRVWTIPDGACVRVFKAHAHWVKTVRFTPDAATVVSGGLDKQIFVWDVPSESVKPKGKPFEHEHFVLDVDCSPIQPYVISTSRDRTVSLWDLQTLKVIRTHTDHPSWPCTIAFSPDGRYFASGSFDNHIFIHATKTGDLTRKMHVHNHGILRVLFVAPDRLLVGTSGGAIQIVDL